MQKSKFILFLMFAILLAASCKKTPDYKKLTDSKSEGLIYIQQAFKEGNILKLKIFPPTDEASTQMINVNYGAIGLPAQDISIQLEKDQDAIDSVNEMRITAGLPEYENFPADAYSIDNWKLTIPKGQTSSKDVMTLQYYTKKFDPAKEYLLAIKIKDASGYTVNEKLRTVFVIVGKLEESKVAKTGWAATAQSEELVGEGPNNGAARFAIDGKISSFWHTEWSGANPPLPLWLKVDMSEPRYLTKIGLTTRQGDDRGCSKFKLELSMDGTNWTVIGDNLTMDPSNYSEQTFSFPITRCRYIRYTALEGDWGWNDFTFLAELDAYEVK